MKKLQNQKGALVLEAAMVVITLAALGFAFYTVNQTRSDVAKQPAQTADQSKPAVKAPAAPVLSDKDQIIAAAKATDNGKALGVNGTFSVDSIDGNTAHGRAGDSDPNTAGGGYQFTATKTNGVWAITNEGQQAQ